MTNTKTRTITLTDRPPVRIVEDEWPIIASSGDDSYIGSDYGRRQQALGQGECDEYRLTVRQHQDGRALVYGVLSAADRAWGAPAGGESWRGGELLLTSDDDIAMAIRRVGAAGNMPDTVIRACIADLPAEKL